MKNKLLIMLNLIKKLSKPCNKQKKVYEPINDADFKSVILKNGTPHCLVHGAMNMVSKHEDGGGYWRCVSSVSTERDNCCRTGCCEIRKYV